MGEGDGDGGGSLSQGYSSKLLRCGEVGGGSVALHQLLPVSQSLQDDENDHMQAWTRRSRMTSSETCC